MTKIVFAIPGDIELPTGGYAYGRRMFALLPQYGCEVTHLELPRSYPVPIASDLVRTSELVQYTPSDCVLLIDGLAYGAMPENIVRGFARRIVALVHHPLCLETGISEQCQQQLRVSEQRALAHASAVICTSKATQHILGEQFGVPPERLHVAEPGTDPAPRARGTGGPLNFLAVGSVIPRKGYDLLIEALQPYRGRPWTLTIAGADGLDSAYGAAIKNRIIGAGLISQVQLSGAVSPADLTDLYDRADVFVMPSRYEGYGMVMTEALARGLAVICTTGVAAAGTVPEGAVFKVEADDVQALTTAIGKALDDDAWRQNLADAAWSAARNLPTWNDTAARIAKVLRRVAP
jgi:glycosyltransferase involved in cell wall biosynthesis